MFKTESFFIFGLVLVLADAQQGPPAEPSPSNIQKSWGSYSDFPGLLMNKNSVTNIPRNGQNKVEHRNVPNESSGSRAVKQFSGPIVIPGRSRSYSPLTSNVGPKPVPVQANSYSSIPKSVQSVPVAAVAASELAQGAVKPRPPLKTGTDTWTPMGYTGSGKPYEAVIKSTSQQLPYDTAKSKQTIGEQIRQRQQQQQQQQQQYDIFGFPINNSPDPFADLFGFAPSNGLFGPMPAAQDPFFGSFGGAVRGQSQGGQETGGHGPVGNMLETMLMMQLFAGGDAPDPQPRATGRGRGRGRGRGAQAQAQVQAPLTPESALDQLFRLEEIRMMRNQQRQRVNRNRGMPENQRRGSFARGQSPPGYAEQNPRQPGPMNTMPQETYSPGVNTANTIPRPPPARSSAVVLLPGSSPRRPASAPAPARRSLHPEVLDRRNMPTTLAPTPQGQEPVEREGPRQAQRAPQVDRQPPFRQQAIERRSFGGFNVQRGAPVTAYNEPLAVGTTILGQGYNAFQNSVQGSTQQYQQPNNNPMPPRDQRFARRNRGQNTVPRNIQQLVNNPLFQRRLRTAGAATPAANSADLRADQADLMADRADNLQSISPLQRMFGMAMAGARANAGRTSAAGTNPLANMFGSSGGGAGALLGLGM